MSPYIIVRRLNGSYAIMDEGDDAPLVTVHFHNEADQLPDDIKGVLVRQMVDPVGAPHPWKDRLITVGLSVAMSTLTWLALHWFVR